MAHSDDRPGIDPSTFSGKHDPHDLRVTGDATGDYRIESVSLVRAAHQENQHTLVLDVEAKVGPVKPVHNELIRNFPLTFVQRPGAGITHVEIVNGPQRFTFPV